MKFPETCHQYANHKQLPGLITVPAHSALSWTKLTERIGNLAPTDNTERNTVAASSETTGVTFKGKDLALPQCSGGRRWFSGTPAPRCIDRPRHLVRARKSFRLPPPLSWRRTRWVSLLPRPFSRCKQEGFAPMVQHGFVRQQSESCCIPTTTTRVVENHEGVCTGHR